MKSFPITFIFIVTATFLKNTVQCYRNEYLFESDKEAFQISEYKSDETRPSFLYDTNNGPRIVEFYTHWNK